MKNLSVLCAVVLMFLASLPVLAMNPNQGDSDFPTNYGNAGSAKNQGTGGSKSTQTSNTNKPQANNANDPRAEAAIRQLQSKVQTQSTQISNLERQLMSLKAEVDRLTKSIAQLSRKAGASKNNP